MEKIFSILVLFVLLSPNLYAQEQPYPDKGGEEIHKPVDELVNLDTQRALQRIQSLEAEVKDLKAANRSQDQRIQVLEHDIDSLRKS